MKTARANIKVEYEAKADYLEVKTPFGRHTVTWETLIAYADFQGRLGDVDLDRMVETLSVKAFGESWVDLNVCGVNGLNKIKITSPYKDINFCMFRHIEFHNNEGHMAWIDMDSVIRIIGEGFTAEGYMNQANRTEG